ncbi:MAG: dihydroorotase [Proteobacteria bacterium]|nr:MAG: dihydroorotase [Pseudomonadota bacterium]
MNITIAGGRVIDPASGLDKTIDIHIQDRHIAALGQPPAGYEADEIIDAAGMVVAPGLIDMQARLREPGEDHTGSMESELAAAVKGGVTTVCVPPDTYPPIDTPAMVHMIRQRVDAVGLAKVFPIGALTVALEGERLTDMGSLHQAGCTVLSNSDRTIQNTLVMRRALQYASTFDLTVLLNAQDPWLVGNGCVHEGEVATRLGLPVIPEAAETVGVARDLALVETTGTRAHFSCLSSAKSVAMVAEAQRRGLPVTASVTSHHLHLSEADVGMFDTQCKVMPPLRSERDREALRAAIADGVITVVCSDHQAHGKDAKLAPFSEAASGIAGIETLVGLTMKLVGDGVLAMHEALAALTINPARILGLDRGTISAGVVADICVFDPDQPWTLASEKMRSRGANTPFMDTELTGRVQATLVEGRLVYLRRG